MSPRASPHPTERWPRSAAAGLCALALAFGVVPARAEARRCGTERHLPVLPFAELAQGDRTNCSASLTHPDPRYREGGLYEFVMVVHVIESEDGDGALSDEAILDQVRVVNEDFRSLLGQAQGRADTQISFRLASADPEGGPTSGITRTVDDDWFHDRGAYWKRLAWDPTRYVNVYTNDAAGLLGYTFLPADGGSEPGEVSDRVVIHWQRFGRGRGEAGNAGRTLTHELGHYLGLDHTFAPNPTVPETFVCAPGESPDCYTTGDLLCDTPSEDSANEACEPRSTCGGADPVENFMNYTPDRCMDRFSPEQALRMRCTALAYRPDALWPSGKLLATELPRDGDVAHFSVSLWNESSFAQDFSVSVLESDFEVALAGGAQAQGLGLGPQETLELPLVVELSGAEATGSVRLAARSDLNLVPTELELEVVPVPRPELLLSTASDTVEVSALEETKVTVELENLGVVEERVDVELGGRWVTRSDLEGPLELAAFERREFDVWVRPDDQALPGETAPLRLSAASRRAPARVERRTLSLVATRWLGAELAAEPASLEARPGSTGRITFWLSNLGNGKESFRLGVASDRGVSAWPERWELGPLRAFDGSGPVAVEVAYRVDEGAPLDRELGLRLSATPNDAAEELAAAEATFVVSEAGRVRVEADRTLAATAFGEPQHFTLEIRNWSKRDDEFRARVRGESRVLSEKTQVLPLRAGQSTELEVVLSPRRARFVREATQVTVTSLLHPERTRSVELLLVPRARADAGSAAACEDCPSDGGCSLRAPTRQDAAPAALWLTVASWLIARRRRPRQALRG